MGAQQLCGIVSGTGIVVAGLFAALSLIHVYWALGGTVGLDAAVPERPSSHGDGVNATVKAFHPSTAMTLLVAGALAAVSALVSLRAGLFTAASTHWSLRWSMAVVALILLARAVGDRNLVGVFKRVRGTRFAILDSWLYCPLCIALALGLILLACSPKS